MRKYRMQLYSYYVQFIQVKVTRNIPPRYFVVMDVESNSYTQLHNDLLQLVY